MGNSKKNLESRSWRSLKNKTDKKKRMNEKKGKWEFSSSKLEKLNSSSSSQFQKRLWEEEKSLNLNNSWMSFFPMMLLAAVENGTKIHEEFIIQRRKSHET